MSDFPCPHCGDPIDLFGSGGGEATAMALAQLTGTDVPLMAKIPFDVKLREGGDTSIPLVLSDPDRPASIAITNAAKLIAGKPRGVVGMSLGISSSR